MAWGQTPALRVFALLSLGWPVRIPTSFAESVRRPLDETGPCRCFGGFYGPCSKLKAEPLTERIDDDSEVSMLGLPFG
jgi:hypothetical protein